MYKEVSLFFSLLCFSVLTNEVTTLMRTSGDLGVSYSSMHASKLCFNNNDEQVYCAQSRNHSPGTLSSDKVVLHNETKQEYKNWCRETWKLKASAEHIKSGGRRTNYIKQKPNNKSVNPEALKGKIEVSLTDKISMTSRTASDFLFD